MDDHEIYSELDCNGTCTTLLPPEEPEETEAPEGWEETARLDDEYETRTTKRFVLDTHDLDMTESHDPAFSEASGADEPIIIDPEGRELARSVGPVALTSGGVVSAAVLAVGGPTLLAVLAGVVVFGFAVVVLESSLRRIANDGEPTIQDGSLQGHG